MAHRVTEGDCADYFVRSGEMHVSGGGTVYD